MKSFIASILILAVVGMVVGVVATAADTGTVTATVCPKLISVNVSPSSVDYGIQALSATNLTPSPPSVTLTNNGNVNETFSIKGGDATPSGAGTNWTLAGTVAPDQYIHRSSPDNTTFTPLTASYEVFADTDTTKVTADSACDGTTGDGGTKTLYLNMDTPTDTTTQDTFSAPVTILATE